MTNNELRAFTLLLHAIHDAEERTGAPIPAQNKGQLAALVRTVIRATGADIDTGLADAYRAWADGVTS